MRCGRTFFCRGYFTGGTNANPVERDRQLLGFLTTEANDTAGAIRPKAIPVILTERDQIETWMTAPAEEALTLQKRLPDSFLSIVARGERQDEGPALVDR